MATAWSLTTLGVIKNALAICGVIGDGEPVRPADNETCLTALQNILKELPLHGVVWSKITSDAVALAWSGVTPAKITLPVDYYGSPVVYRTQDDAHVPIRIITKAEYDAIPQPEFEGEYPT